MAIHGSDPSTWALPGPLPRRSFLQFGATGLAVAAVASGAGNLVSDDGAGNRGRKNERFF